MILRSAAGLTAAWLAAVPAIVVHPPGDTVGFRAYALGVIPIDGRFSRFRGRLLLDGSGCRLELVAEAASLELASAERTAQVVGPEFLNAPQFPELSYVGTCSGGGMAGVLTLHGLSRPLDMKLVREPGVFRAEAQAVRAEWGITAQPMTIGAHLRLSVEIKVP